MDALKSDLRKIMREKRKLIAPEIKTLAMHQVRLNLMPLLANAKRVAVYYKAGSELDLGATIDYCLTHEISVFTPIATKISRQMYFEQVLANSPRPVFYPENYIAYNKITADDLDLVLLPLVAVDKTGIRLGQGGGYYDATLANCRTRPLLCGVGYAWQLIDNLPHESWDIKLDYFVSETGLVKFC